MVIADLNHDNFYKFYACFAEVMREGYGEFSPKLIEHFLQKDYSQTNFLFWLERKFRKIILAMDEQAVVGFLVGDHTYGGVGFISWIGVKPAYRNQGIATELMLSYEKYAKSKHAHLLELFTSQKLMGFYERLGYQEIGRRKKGYFGQEGVIMDKVVGEWKIENLENF